MTGPDSGGEACTCGDFAGTSVRYADCPVHCPRSAPAVPDVGIAANLSPAGGSRKETAEPVPDKDGLREEDAAQVIAQDWLSERQGRQIAETERDMLRAQVAALLADRDQAVRQVEAVRELVALARSVRRALGDAT